MLRSQLRGRSRCDGQAQGSSGTHVCHLGASHTGSAQSKNRSNCILWGLVEPETTVSQLNHARRKENRITIDPIMFQASLEFLGTLRQHLEAMPLEIRELYVRRQLTLFRDRRNGPPKDSEAPPAAP